MAMDKDILGQAIADAVAAAFPGLAAGEKAKLVAAWKTVADAIIVHLKARMVVQSNVSVTSVSGVLAGGGVSGPGSGSSTSSSIT
jgi:hypothetical protein